jgi:hypothetical protein
MIVRCLLLCSGACPLGLGLGTQSSHAAGTGRSGHAMPANVNGADELRAPNTRFIHNFVTSDVPPHSAINAGQPITGMTT